MRQPISWSALADARVGVWGLGVEGQASIRRLAALGVAPVLVDDAPSASEMDGRAVMSTEPDGLRALLECDVVVKSPGISRYRPEVTQLEDAGVAVCGGLGLFMAEADPARVACITGTKGKSTTTAIAVHLLRGLGYDARAGGNIGRPPWDPSEEGDPDYWIVETSSFQVPDLAVAPHVVAVTSLSPDHLDWHGTVERYYADKLSLCTKPGVTLAVADGSDERLRAQAGQMGPHVRWVDAEEVARDDAWSSVLGLAGPHNARNAAIASRRPSTSRAWSGPPPASTRCRAGSARSGVSARWSSSTTGSPPTCCPPRLPWPRSRTGRSRCSWVGTTAASTTRRWRRPWRHAWPRRSW
jgi:UDP-N-acetylmuramoylalanine--D-glutamate ligase